MKRGQGKGQGKGKGRSKRTRRAFFGDEWRSEEDQFGGPTERKARRACQNSMMASVRVVFARISPTMVQARTFPKTKAEERIKKEKANGELIFNPDPRPQKHQMKKDMARPGNQTIGLPVIGLMIPGLQMLGGSVQCLFLHGWWQFAIHPTHVVLDLGCTQSIGSRTAIERFKKHAWYYCITTEFCPSNKSFVFANSGGENLGLIIELDPKGDKITCPAFGLYSSPAEHSTMGHIVQDLTSLAYQPTTKSREQPGYPKRHVTLAMSERRPAHPAHAPDMDEDEDEDDKPFAGEERDLDTDDEDLLPFYSSKMAAAAPVRKRKGPPAWQDPAAFLEHEVPKDSRERAEDTSKGRR